MRGPGTKHVTCIIKGDEVDRGRGKKEKKRGKSIVHRCVRRAVKQCACCAPTRRR